MFVARAHVIDNSEFGKPHRRVLERTHGKAIYASRQMPAWTRTLYAAELRDC